MPYPASLVAYAFVKKGIDEGNPVTQMKLQKLVYFAHGIHLANFDKPLIKEIFQAWKFGPVVPVIYHDYKLYGSSPITDTDLFFSFSNHNQTNSDFDLTQLDDKSLNSIDTTWDALKDINASQLSNWTHKDDSPWKQYFHEGVNDIQIPNPDIQQYFKTAFIHS